ncbi:beta-N-acetylhexosaminidase [Bacillus sp. JJ1566]|uniref:beta-N-acetylhexosaminidase n=1 Tax=Bacillus sp. JJ1566 TaxID=3122961 RepID=UPI002FFEBD5E
MNRTIIRLSLLLLFFLFGCSQDSQDEMEYKDGMDRGIVEQINRLSLEEKMGQMLMVGVNGYFMDNSTKQMITDYHVGGFVILGSNVRDELELRKLIETLKETNKTNNHPLLLAIDEEGGRITRFPENVSKLPSNQKVGQLNNQDLSYKIGGLLAEKVAYFGFNMNFAPVLDVNSNPRNRVIGDRSFSSNPQVVSKLGIKTMQGIRDNGVIPVIKHFPGHGDTFVDSHLGLPTLPHDQERLRSIELHPFANAIKEKADVVMTAHILLPKLDASNPATISKAVITELLRKELGFEGVVITDDLTMGAIAKHHTVGEAAVKSVLAGSDILLIAHHHPKAKEAIEALGKAVADGEISEKRINESVYRILALKKKYKLDENQNQSSTLEEINQKIDEVVRKYF